MTRRARLATAALAVLLVTSMVAGPVAGQSFARGEPDISAHLPDNDVTPGSESTLEVQLLNDGELEAGLDGSQVKTARGVTVAVDDAGPFEVTTERTALGTIQDGQVVTAPFRVTAPEDLEPGTYQIDLEVEYSYTSGSYPNSGFTNERTETEDVSVTVEVVDEPRFAIGNVSTDVQPGTSGEATVPIENVGSSTAYEARATVSGSGGVTVGGSAGAAEAYLGTLAPGEVRNVTVDASVAESVVAGDTPVEAAVRYRDDDGVDREAPPAYGSLHPEAEQEVAIEDLADTLSVGYDGEIRGTLRNEGPTALTDAVLVIEPTTDSLIVEERRYALPELAAGEAADFAFPTDVGGSADPGPRQVRFSVEYSNDGRQTATVGPVSERVVVDERQSAFGVENVRANVTAGGSTELVVAITNQRPEPLSNVNAKVYADSPLSVANDEAFVDELAPNGTTEIRFSVSASAGTMAKTYPVEMDFQYDTARGETVLSDTYQQPVAVSEPVDDGGGPSPVILIGGLVAVIALIAGGVVLYRRR
ncbi:COG1361 S-layer family protein [Haloparvum sedimenti]|uniref:COG1361 S-layer family protein n=1 Tax=Haloparvum sedimenti TaxID=1678448 RepID=UPI00071E76B4|nr:COG1361 S-layer family protein [Haloparvum sedimenti]